MSLKKITMKMFHTLKWVIPPILLNWQYCFTLLEIKTNIYFYLENVQNLNTVIIIIKFYYYKILLYLFFI